MKTWHSSELWLPKYQIYRTCLFLLFAKVDNNNIIRARERNSNDELSSSKVMHVLLYYRHMLFSMPNMSNRNTLMGKWVSPRLSRERSTKTSLSSQLVSRTNLAGWCIPIDWLTLLPACDQSGLQISQVTSLPGQGNWSRLQRDEGAGSPRVPGLGGQQVRRSSD